MSWFARHRIYAALYVLGLVVYGGLAGDRLFRQSSDPHFIYQADAWLHGQVAIHPPPAKGDDWAKVETIVTNDGRVVRGRRRQSGQTFQSVSGETFPVGQIADSRGVTYYVSFPPFPSVLMLPAAAIAGRAGNDVLPTILIAALILPLAFATLRRIAAAGMSSRSRAEDLWFTSALGFGTVLFFAAVQGRVWFTAHVVGVALALGYAWASIDARRPVIAGLCLSLAAITRTPMAFMFPLFLLETWRTSGGLVAWRTDRSAFVRDGIRRVAWFAAPVIAIAILAAAYNVYRFSQPTEFGHSYLAVRQQAQIEAYGLFDLRYLARNLAVAFTLMPELTERGPTAFQISGHGLALWITTPGFVLLLWPERRPPLHFALWLTVAFVAIPTFFYQNSGWVQFGYRFSLDYTPFLILLLAVGGRPLTRMARALIVVGIVVNLFGAWSFTHRAEYYRTGGNAYGTVVAH